MRLLKSDLSKSSSVGRHSTVFAPQAETVSITYVEADGTEKAVQAEVGMNMMEVAHDNGVELEGRLRLSSRYFVKCNVQPILDLHAHRSLTRSSRGLWRRIGVFDLPFSVSQRNIRYIAVHGSRRRRYVGFGLRSYGDVSPVGWAIGSAALQSLSHSLDFFADADRVWVVKFWLGPIFLA